MGLCISHGIGIPFNKQSELLSSYWTTRKINSLSVVSNNATTQTITADISGSGFDGVSFEYCYYNEIWKVAGTSANGVYNASGLPANTMIYWRARLYKGSHYSDYCDVSYAATYFASNWFLSGGIAAENCIGAYTPRGASSLADSYVNKANPGTYDLTLGVAPTWTKEDGWSFNGSQYLKTGIIPVNDQSWTAILLYDNYNTGAMMPFGLYESATKAFGITLNGANASFYNGNGQSLTLNPKNSVIGIRGQRAVIVKSDVGGITAGSGSITYDIWIGQTHYSAPANWYTGNIKAIAFYNRQLSIAEYNAVVDAITIPVYDSIYLSDITLRHNYVDRAFGSLICFDMASFRSSAYEVGLTNGDVNTFNPTGLDIDEWLDACVSAGMKYAILTAKHHCGFKLWVSASKVGANAVYGINSTTWYSGNGNPDIVGLFITKCRSRNLKVGLYYSIWDTTYEAQVGAYTWAGYIAMIEAELTELLTNYGNIDSLWFDGWQWHVTYGNIPYATIYNFVKSKQPNCLVVENAHTWPSLTSEIDTYETPIDGSIPALNIRLSEEIDTIRNDSKWFYHSDLAQDASKHYTKTQINARKAQVNARFGAYLLGLTPGTDGHLPAFQKILLESLTT